MITNSFGKLSCEKLIILNYSFEREFFRDNIRDIFIEKYRAMHLNVLFFLIATLIFLRFDLNNFITCFVILSLYLTSFIVKIYAYNCVILQKNSFVKIKINESNLEDAKILINLFLDLKNYETTLNYIKNEN